MYPLVSHFEQLLRNIQPPQARLDAARDITPLVREYLRQYEDFETVDPHSRLVGSYAQGLTVGDVKDVDFLVRVPGDPDANDPAAIDTIRNLKSALDSLPEVLSEEGYAEVDIERARRSVHVHIKDADFHIDAVPCIAPNGFDEPIFVPDRGFDSWIPSHPVGFVSLLSDLNAQHGQKVKPLGKLLKHFRNNRMQSRRPKSYWLGTLLVHHVQDGLDTSRSLGEMFNELVDRIYCQYDHLLHTSDEATPNIKDPLLGHNVSWNWKRTHFETFMRRLDEARKWSDCAITTEDREEAIGLWQRVFGESFPSEVKATATNAAQAMSPGKSFVTRTGLITSAPALATPTLATKFHGET